MSDDSENEDLDSLRRAAEREPDAPKPWIRLGWAYGDHGRHGTALRLFEKATALAEDNPNVRAIAFNGMAQCYMRLGIHDRAEESVTRAIGLRPRSDRYEMLGVIRELRGADDEAEEAYRLGLDLDPDDPDLWARLAMCLVSRREADEADALLDRALEIDPEHTAAKAEKAGILAAYHRAYSEAERYLREALAAAEAREERIEQPYWIQKRLVLAQVLWDQGRRAEAEREMIEARRLDPTDAFAAAKLCDFYGRTGRLDDGLDHLREAVELDPEDERIRRIAQRWGVRPDMEGPGDEAF